MLHMQHKMDQVLWAFLACVVNRSEKCSWQTVGHTSALRHWLNAESEKRKEMLPRLAPHCAAIRLLLSSNLSKQAGPFYVAYAT
jgi:hypothetical protein